MASAEVLTSVNAAGARRRSKYLVFRPENLKSALEILSVEDIFKRHSSTESEGVCLPATCGRDVPIVDLRPGAKAFSCAKGREGDEEDERERYFAIVVETEAHHSRFAIGLVVDRVAEILDLDPENWEGNAESKSTAASGSRNASRELTTARILDLDTLLPRATRLDHQLSGFAAGAQAFC